MSNLGNRHAIFAGLIVNEDDEPVGVRYVGDEPFYVIPDGDFERHVETSAVDDAVLQILHEQILSMQDVIVENVLKILGREDLFTKASVDVALKNFKQAFRQADPQQWKPWLGMMGFKIVVNVHGEVVRVDYPEQKSGGL